jgi:peptide/nickel transport system substrate-binding protein
MPIYCVEEPAESRKLRILKEIVMTTTPRWKWISFTVVWLLLVVLGTACNGTIPPEPEKAEVRIGWPRGPVTLNPLVAGSGYAEEHIIFNMVYDSLYILEPDHSYSSPLLTQEPAVSADGTVWTFTLRDDAIFHDETQTPLTAQDVAFSYNLYATRSESLVNDFTEHFQAVEAPSDTEVVLTLDEAIPNLKSQLLSLYILPEHIWGEIADEEVLEFDNANLFGSGPFKLREYKQGQFIRLAINQDYAGALPHIDEVIYQTFETSDARVNALQNGEVDMITLVSPAVVSKLQDNADIEVVIGSAYQPYIQTIFLNVLQPEDCPPDDGICTGHAALRDRTVRQALAHATDKQKIITVVLDGLGTPGLTLIPEGMGAWYNDTIEDYPFDLGKANALLDEAGYVDTDGDGVREMPGGGEPLIFRLYWPDYVNSHIADLLADSWRQIGVEVEPQEMDEKALLKVCCSAFDYDIIIWNAAPVSNDPDGLLKMMWSEDIQDGQNETGFSDPAYDELYEQQIQELDEQKRQTLVWQMQEIMHQEVNYIIPYYKQAVQAYRRDRFSGWVVEPTIALEHRASLLQITPVE